MGQFTIQQAMEIAIEHHQAGRLGPAEAMYRQILSVQPDFVDALQNLGAIAIQVGQLEAAVQFLSRVVTLSPGNFDAQTNLASAWINMERFDQAIAAGERALKLRPADVGVLNSLGMAWKGKGDIDQAIACFKQALNQQPGFVEALNNLGLALVDIGQPDQAMDCYRKALAIHPQLIQLYDTLLCGLHYRVNADLLSVMNHSQQWNSQYAQSFKKLILPHSNDRDPNRRLRIGYVSADFCSHVVNRFFLPLFMGHDKETIDIFCYSNVRQPDAVTQSMQAYAEHWHNMTRLNDDQAAALMRQHKIDILVDLSGHTTGNRLLVFARNPAPVQVTYLGYPATTGMDAIDYRMTDIYADPLGLTENQNSETLIRLDPTAWCFHPPDESPPVNELPLKQTGVVTFGSFNNFAKVSDVLIGWWIQILQAVPGSRLLVKAKALHAEIARNRILSRLSSAGIAIDRVELRGWVSAADHLPMYQQVDISLDSFPYHGTTTTCESLWMGVPVITLAGPSHASRVGVSLLTNIGLPELIATTSQQYIQIAADLAADLPRLVDLRSTLRQRLQNSPLMDAPRFARNVERAYRTMWMKWCSTTA